MKRTGLPRLRSDRPMSRQALGSLIAAMALAGMAACSGASARSDAQQRDSPPPKPMPAPQVVARKSTDPVFDASTVAALFPMPTQDLLVTARDKARKEWRADATITRVRYQWVFNPPDTHSWVEVTVNSPGDGAQRNYSFGDVYDGKVFDFDMTGRADAKARATERAIGDVRAGLEEARRRRGSLATGSPFPKSISKSSAPGASRTCRPGACWGRPPAPASSR